MIYTVKGFSVVNEAKADVLLEFSSFFYDSMDVGNLISGSFAFSKSSLNIWKFLVCGSLHIHLEVLGSHQAGSLAWRILSTTLLSCELRAIMQ